MALFHRSPLKLRRLNHKVVLQAALNTFADLSLVLDRVKASVGLNDERVICQSSILPAADFHGMARPAGAAVRARQRPKENGLIATRANVIHTQSKIWKVGEKCLHFRSDGGTAGRRNSTVDNALALFIKK